MFVVIVLASMPATLAGIIFGSIYGFGDGGLSPMGLAPVKAQRMDDLLAEAELIGIDTATPISSEVAELMVQNGVSFVGRYLVPTRYHKALTKEEAQGLSAAGLQIFVYYEINADDALKGAERGTKDGKSAYQCAKDIGLPSNAIIYFTVDCSYPDTSPTGMAKYNGLICDYLDAARAETGEYEIGLYGPYPTLEYAKSNSPCVAYVQSVGGSGKNVSDAYTIYQLTNTSPFCGIGVDWCSCRNVAAAGFFTID